MGEPGYSPLCIWVQHQHRTQEGLAPLLSDPPSCPQRPLGNCHVGKFSQLVPSSYHTQALEQGPRHPRIGRPHTVRINSGPFCTWVRAHWSLSFSGDISNYESHTTVKTRGRLCNGPAAQPPTPTVWGQDPSSQRGGKTLCPFPWEQMRQLPTGFSVRTSDATE